jgi:hypothetical protein
MTSNCRVAKKILKAELSINRFPEFSFQNARPLGTASLVSIFLRGSPRPDSRRGWVG